MNESDKEALQAILNRNMNRIDAERIYNQACIKSDSLPVSMGSIKTSLEHYFGLERGTIEREGRCQKIAMARHIAFYLCYTMLNSSYPQLGRVFANRDHTTVMHGVKRVYNSRALSAIAADVARAIRGEAPLEQVSKARLGEIVAMEGVNYRQ